MNTKTRKPDLRHEILGVTFGNPRRLAVFHGWPSPTGPIQREIAVLRDDSGRERGITWTTGRPKLTAGWHDRYRIVDGSNGRTYVFGYSGDVQGHQGNAVAYRGNLKADCICVYDGECELWYTIRALCFENN